LDEARWCSAGSINRLAPGMNGSSQNPVFWLPEPLARACSAMKSKLLQKKEFFP
jgi:hypothetical protein